MSSIFRHVSASSAPKSVGKASIWKDLDEPARRLLVEYMDVKTLCRVDTAMTNKDQRQKWFTTLKGLHLEGLNKWKHYSNLNAFKGLKWSTKRDIVLRGIQIRIFERNPHHSHNPNQPQYLERHDQFPWLCHKGYVDIARLLVETSSIDVNQAAAGGYSLLINATGCGDVRLMEALLNAGANVNHCNGEGGSALMLASAYGHVEIVKLLLAHGADYKLANKEKMTILMHANGPYGHDACIEELIRAGAPVDEVDGRGMTALFHACMKGSENCVKALLRNEANMDLTNESNHTSLDVACLNGHSAVVKILLDWKAKLGLHISRDKLPLRFAAEYGRPHIIQECLDRGADINAHDKMGQVSCLTLAIRQAQNHDATNSNSDYIGAIRVLLQGGADPEYRPSPNAYTALEFACISGKPKSLEIVKILVEEGNASVLAQPSPCIHHPRRSRSFPLHLACEYGNFELVKYFLQHLFRSGLLPLLDEREEYVQVAIMNQHYIVARLTREFDGGEDLT